MLQNVITFNLFVLFLVSLQEAVGPDNIEGYGKVQKLARYLVLLRDQPGALTHDQASKIIRLWDNLSDYDKMPTIFSPRRRSKLTQGRFKASKSIVKSGVESTKR